ncbi:hypothetical protein B1K96_38500, partial [Escherichia coli]
VMSRSERMSQMNKNDDPSGVKQVQSQMQQDLKQRIIKASENETDRAKEEFIQQKRQDANYKPFAMTRDELIQQRTQALSATSDKEATIRGRVQATGDSSTVDK